MKHCQEKNGKYYPYFRFKGRAYVLSQQPTPDDAAALAAHTLHLLRTGQITPESIYTPPRDPLILGKTLTEWAKSFKVSRNAIYKAAKNKNLSLEQEIRLRLGKN